MTNPAARAFYELEATRERWTVPQLERQITALLFERLTQHRNPDEVRALARDGQHVATPADVIKDHRCRPGVDPFAAVDRIQSG
jgi:predicted nuclease of restriction endonuclease-like (RecB) superfamily